MSAHVAVPTRDLDESSRLSLDDLDQLRGLFLAEMASALARVAEHEAMLFSAPSDAFGAELRRYAKASIARSHEVVADLEAALERLVEIHGSCEWCDTEISPEQRSVIPPGRLCAECCRR